MVLQQNKDSANASKSSDISSHKLLVVGLVRNCSQHIKADVQRLREVLKSFPNVHWLLIESDSQDDSVKHLNDLAAEIKTFQFRSLGSLRERMPLRTERIAHCRNVYLDEINNNPAYKDINYVVMSDFDGLNQLITEQAFLSCWSRDDWDVVVANQRGPYYDIWALRHKLWCPSDCKAHYNFLVQYNLGAEKSLFVAVHSKMLTIPENSDWIEVDSAFGGLAVYRRDVLRNVRYVGLTESGDEICEHVPLHAALRSQNYRIFINPRFINAMSTEHTQHDRLVPRLKIKAKNMAKYAIIKVFGADAINTIKKRFPR